MESTLMAAGVQGALADKTGGAVAASSTQATRFEALMQQSPSSLLSSADRYIDEVAPLQGSAQHAVTLPEEISKLGEGFSELLRSRRQKFEETAASITDPYLLEVRDQIKDAVDFQRTIMTMSITMKSVELSVQSCSQLFKMQG